MSRCRARCLALTALTLSTAFPAGLLAADDPGIALPPVPRAVLLAAAEGAGPIRKVSAVAQDGETPRPEGAEKGTRSEATFAVGPKTLTVSPGTTAIVEVAIDHLNRIVTPFASPQVRTVSGATTEVEGNAVYVATASEEPVGLFLTDAGDPATALSLTLAPRHIPPREVRLVLADGPRAHAPVPVTPGKEPARSGDQPYVEHLATVFRALAEERVPAGYGLRAAGKGERVTCAQVGLKLTTGQVLEGPTLRVLAARAENTGSRSLELDERTCRGREDLPVAAVAAWPRVWLAPAEATELYVAIRPRAAESVRRERPSLLDGTR
jgi:conjugal transfer pilus assembly protein TraK